MNGIKIKTKVMLEKITELNQLTNLHKYTILLLQCGHVHIFKLAVIQKCQNSRTAQFL